jgi:alpha-L-rhamnosidase
MKSKFFYYLKYLLLVLCFALPTQQKAQVIDSVYLLKQWSAQWIKVPKSSSQGYGVYHFRKNFDLKMVPSTFPVHVSGDNRYKFYINEKLISMGPTRSDLLHWNFETVDLAPYLEVGKNVVTALVWNEGEQRPIANISLQTAFILQGGNEQAQVVNTNKTWKCIENKAYSPIFVKLSTYYVAGHGEKIDMRQDVKDWKKRNFDDSNWQSAETIMGGKPKYKIGFGDPDGWLLMPSPLPPMELTQQRFAVVRRTEGVNMTTDFLTNKTDVIIPAQTQATFLLDQTVLTNAYPTLIFSGGKDSKIAMSYAEGLFTKYPIKNNRNDIDGKTMVGRVDSLISDGSNQQTFTALAWRTFRYVEIKIQTADSPLVLEDIYSTFTGYPFELKAKINTDNNDIQQMMDIGWRTARLCATETYMDCPYYEQLQYIGDTRIQALVTLFNSGDERLVRNALNQIDYSRQPEGITQSRYPTATPQYIPPFSMWYIGMLHDYMMYGKDPLFVKNKMHGVRQILNYFSTYQQADGSIKNLPWWNFSDWVNKYSTDNPNWNLGIRAAGKDGNSALIDLQLLLAYQAAADMESRVGQKAFADYFNQEATRLKNTIRTKYWDNTKQLFADRSEKDLFSQHANALAILGGLVSDEDAPVLAQKMLTDNTLAPASIYFKFYLHSALTKAGLGNDYLKWLGVWRENIQMGLTTWGETSDVEKTRSDCHAWGSSPNIEFFRIVLGIDSEDIGFSKVKIEPHLGDLTKVEGKIPHPKGEIAVSYKLEKSQWLIQIDLPKTITGTLVWKGKNINLKEGLNQLKRSALGKK